MRKLARWSLEYLGRGQEPLWGGHLKRGEPISNPEMQQWVDDGWIEVVGTEGYVLTELGRRALGATDR